MEETLQPLRKKKVLIADDDRDLVEVLKITLEGEGYQTIIAYDGIEALRKTQEEKPDLIILDIMMPRADGWTVEGSLKASQETQKIPIIILSSKELLKDVEKSLSLGAVTHLPKPFDVRRLLRKVKELLG